MPKKITHKNAPLKGAKPPAPPAHSHPYVVQFKYGDPLYFEKIDTAKAKVIAALDADHYSFERINAEDALVAIDGLKAEVSAIGVDGGTVKGVLDPYSGIRFQVEIKVRNPV